MLQQPMCDDAICPESMNLMLTLELSMIFKT